MKEIELTSRDREVYESELKEFLPGKIFDVHTHIFPKNCLLPGKSFDAKSCYGKFNFQFTAEDFMECTSLLMPEQQFGFLGFGVPGFHIDIEASAKYLSSIIDNENIFGLTLISPEDDMEDVRRRIFDYGLMGYKPYLKLVKKAPEDVEILDMMSPEQLELANEYGLAIMLHIPKRKRISDPCNQMQMVEMCRRYPNAKIIFAHVGRAYYLQNVIGMLDGIAECPNAYIGTAMVSHPEVLEYTFNNFPRERILFGTDGPLSFIRGKSVEINNQYAYLLGEDFRFGSTIYDADRAVEFTFFYYEQLRGTIKAIQKAGLSQNEIEDFYYNNAVRLLKGVMENPTRR